MSSEAPDSPAPIDQRRPTVWTNPRRPWQVTVIGYFAIAIGYLGMLWKPTTNFYLFSDMKWINPDARLPVLTPLEYTVSLTLVLLGTVTSVLLLASGIGLLKMRPWGRKFVMIYAVLAIGLSLANGVWAYANYERNVGHVISTTTQPMDLEKVKQNRFAVPFFGTVAQLIAPIAILTIMRKDFIRDAFARSRR